MATLIAVAAVLLSHLKDNSSFTAGKPASEASLETHQLVTNVETVRAEETKPSSTPVQDERFRSKQTVIILTNTIHKEHIESAPSIEQPERPTDADSDTNQVLETQIALARLGISCGSIDGVLGKQTRDAISAYQVSAGLRSTGILDEATKERLRLNASMLVQHTFSPEEASQIGRVGKGWLEMSKLGRLGYESLLELVSERYQASPKLLRRLNPATDWSRVGPGDAVTVPNVQTPNFAGKAALIKIRLAERQLAAYGSSTNLIGFFPCSIARRVDKRPLGALRVSVIATNPVYRFDPDVFNESEEARRIGRPLMIPAGPNNPVGTGWIGLDRRGYGIHGTPNPEQVGRTESHGCFRLANWNVEFLIRLAWVGMPVVVEP